MGTETIEKVRGRQFSISPTLSSPLSLSFSPPLRSPHRTCEEQLCGAIASSRHPEGEEKKGYRAMLRRYALGFQAVGRQLSTMSNSTTPLEDTIRAKITAAFNP